MRRLCLSILLLAGCASSAPAGAQSLAQRVDRAPAGRTVTFQLPARDDICGYRDAIVRFDGSRKRGYSVMWSHDWHGRDELSAEAMRRACTFGPLFITLDRNGRTITDIAATVAATPPAGSTSVGETTSQDAAAFLLGDVVRHAERRAANEAMVASTLLDTEWWPGMLALAKDTGLPTELRKSAVFWLSQAAGEKATRGLTSILEDGSQELELRKHAVFALSQQQNAAAKDALMELATTASEPELRKTALFWLGQRDDPEVLALFQKILTGK